MEGLRSGRHDANKNEDLNSDLPLFHDRRSRNKRSVFEIRNHEK